tara:strand:- start:924 stop:1133 length:210 start_codon:yes stop_codon:yes gene_type:complete
MQYKPVVMLANGAEDGICKGSRFEIRSKIGAAPGYKVVEVRGKDRLLVDFNAPSIAAAREAIEKYMEEV